MWYAFEGIEGIYPITPLRNHLYQKVIKLRVQTQISHMFKSCYKLEGLKKYINYHTS